MTFNFDKLEKLLPKDKFSSADIVMARAALVGHEGTHAAEGVGSAIKWLFSRQERWRFIFHCSH